MKKAIEAGLIKGTIRLYGTPAEETGIGKVYMLRDGLFNDLDVILTGTPPTAPPRPTSTARPSSR